mgnify:CR=1 FL=1
MGEQADIAGSLRYGFSLYHAAKIEGIPYLFVERTPDGTITATGYTVDPSLMIDESAKIGNRIDENTGIGRAFDLTIGLERTAATEGLFKKPDYIARLTADLAHNETSNVTVNSTTGFASSGAIYIGNERIEYTGKTVTQFQTLTRGTPGSTDWKGQDFSTDSQIATWVTDNPLFWRGRKIILYALLVDPYGRVVSSNVSNEVWRGYVAREPRPYPGGWSLACTPLDRRLDVPICASFSGKAVVKPNPDPSLKINTNLSIYIGIKGGTNLAWNAGNTPEYDEWKPFASLSASESYTLTFLKGWLSMQWMAKVAADGVTTYFPADVPKFAPGGPFNAVDLTQKVVPQGKPWKPWEISQMAVRAKVQHTNKPIEIASVFSGVLTDLGAPIWIGYSDHNFGDDPSEIAGPIGVGYGLNVIGQLSVAPATDTDYHWLPLPIMIFTGTQVGVLTIFLDDDDPANVPSAGFLVLEGNDKTVIVEYKNKSVAGNAITVETVNYKGTIEDLLEALGDEDSAQAAISCRFCFIDSGQAVDTMRRLLYSSGRGNNDDGTFDTLPTGSGYDIAEINDNFAKELDGGWSDLSADFLLDEGVSFASIYGPLLALSQRAVVTRNEGDGMKLTCVSTSVIETGAYSFTLTDSHILAGQGGGSVKANNPIDSPNRIEANLTRYEQDMGRIIVNDIVSQRADGLKSMSADINGFNKDEITGPVLGWSKSLFNSRDGRLIYDIKCVPWVECQTGDSIRIESTHFNFWNRGTGKRGYTGSARVMGRSIDLKKGTVTLSVAIAGAVTTYSLAPSAKLVSADNASAPTLITVSADYYALMLAYLAAEPSGFKLLVYKPGTDQTGDEVTVNGVTLAGSNILLSVSAYTLSTALVNGTTYLTVPFTANDSVVQAYHMHTDTTGAAWQ